MDEISVSDEEKDQLRLVVAREEVAESIERLLDKNFVNNLFESNIDKIIRSAQFKVTSCDAIPIKKGHIRKSVIGFKLQLQDTLNKERVKTITFIGKYRADGRGRDTFKLMQDLWKKGFDGRLDGLKISEPLIYLDDLNLSLTSKVDGVELGNLVDHTSLEYFSCYIRQAARWLAKIHRTKLNSAVVYPFKQEEQEANYWIQCLSHLHPDFKEKISHTVSRILESERSLGSEHYVLIHGDFHPMNIFVNGSVSMSAIDLEQSCIFDPARDLGYFMAHFFLRRKRNNFYFDSNDNSNRLSEHIIAKLVRKRFLDEYISVTKISDELLLKRVPAYEARGYIQHLHFLYCVLKNKFDASYFQYWFSRANECLKEM